MSARAKEIKPWKEYIGVQEVIEVGKCHDGLMLAVATKVEGDAKYIFIVKAPNERFAKHIVRLTPDEAKKLAEILLKVA